MSTQIKSSSLQTYQTILYGGALHPELFPLRLRHVVNHGEYDLEAWIMDGAHLLRFEHDGSCACELVTDRETGLPETGVVTAFLCGGERDFEHKFPTRGVNYITTVQTETLSENLFLSTFEELVSAADRPDVVQHHWEDEAGPCLSMIEVDRYCKEVHVQAYHLLSLGGLVLRTQSIFEHK